VNEENTAMTNFPAQICAALALAATSSVASAQTPASPTQLVTVENYNRAQSDINVNRRNLKTGEKRSLREIAAELATLGYVAGWGKPFAAAQVARLIG
jgi:hypothetical protein